MRLKIQITVLAVAWTGQPAPGWLAREIESIDEGIAVGTIVQRNVLDQMEACPPDVLLMEFDGVHSESTWELLAGVRQLSPGTQVILVCEACSTPLLLDSIRHGVSGCLLKSTTPALAAKAVRTVHEGQIWFSRSDLMQALRSQIEDRPFDFRVAPEHEALLTTREREIMDLIGRAMSNKEIARKLQISVATVKTHLHHVYVKLQQSGRYKALLSEDDRHPRLNGGSPQQTSSTTFTAL